MVEDENMIKANRITVLRAKREYQMIKQARQQKQQQMQQQQQQKVKEMIEKIEAENKANEDGKRPRQRRSVICITTGEVFNTIKDAVKKYNVHATNISACCRGKVKHTGQLPDGTPLEWRYIN